MFGGVGDLLDQEPSDPRALGGEEGIPDPVELSSTANTSRRKCSVDPCAKWAGAPGLLLVGVTNQTTLAFDGTLVPIPVALSVALTTNAAGERHPPSVPGVGGPAKLYAQALVADPGRRLASPHLTRSRSKALP